MNKRQIQRADQMARIIQFVLDHMITPAIPRATTLLTELNTLHERMLDFGSEQEGGGNIFRSGSAQRRALRDEILFAVSEISATARALDPAEHPGIRDLFRLNQADKSYQRLVSVAASFLDHLTTPAVKTLFTDRGFEPDFDATLTAQLTAFAAATGTKYHGRQAQKAGTVGLEALSRRAVIVIRELSAIVMKCLRNTNPLLIPVWQAAARPYIPAVTAPQTQSGEQHSNPTSHTSEAKLITTTQSPLTPDAPIPLAHPAETKSRDTPQTHAPATIRVEQRPNIESRSRGESASIGDELQPPSNFHPRTHACAPPLTAEGAF